MSDKADVVPKSPPAHEEHAADVTWDDFVAALPATLAMHSEVERTPAVVRASSRFIVRRMAQGNGAPPRAYKAARAGLRRERRAARRDTSAHLPVEPQHIDERAMAIDSSFAAAASSADALGVPRHRRAAASRWLLSGLLLTGSVVVAVLTSVITVRAMKPTTRNLVASTPTPVVSVVPAVVISRDTGVPVRPAHNEDSLHALDAVPGAIAPTSKTSSDSVAPQPLATRASPSPVRVAHASNRAARGADRRPVSIAEHARTSSQSTSAIPPRLLTTSNAGAASPPVGSAPAPGITTAQQSTAPAASAPSGNNTAVLDELRAIHAEIDARKRHMDSLTAALDSLKQVSKPD